MHALDNVPTRPDTSRLMVLVTDEDRAELRQDLSREGVEERLRGAGFILNVVVNQGFLADPTNGSSHALGLDSNGTAYVVDATVPALFTTVEGGGVDPNPFNSFGSTFRFVTSVFKHFTGCLWVFVHTVFWC